MNLSRHIKLLVAATALLACSLSPTPTLRAQSVQVVDDTTCGCELTYVDGIETTRSGDRYGFRHINGTVIAPNIYLYVGQFTNGYCRVILEDGPGYCGLIDSTGRQVVPCIYDDIENPSEGRILVIKDGLFGYTDMDGKVVIPLQYPRASSFSEGRAAVAVVHDEAFVDCLFIDTLGNQALPTLFQNIMPYHQGYAAAQRYDRWGIIDYNGHEVLTYHYESMTIPEQGLFFAGDSAGLALFRLPTKGNPKVEQLTKFDYMPATILANRRIGVRHMATGKYGFLDMSGRLAVPCIYDEIGLFRMGRTLARQGDLYGIIDTMGRTIVPIRYHDRTPKGQKYMYYDSIAMIELDGKVGYVDLDGTPITALLFEEGYEFNEGLAPVRVKGMWGYIDTKGEPFIPPIFDIASPFQYGRAEVYYNGIPMKINKEGRCVKNCHGVIAFREITEH